MKRHFTGILAWSISFVAAASQPLAADTNVANAAFVQAFETPGPTLVRIYGDKPERIHANKVEKGVGRGGSGGAHLSFDFGRSSNTDLVYYALVLPEPIPIVPELESISFWVKANVPVGIKIGISPYGFIYHGPQAQKPDQWTQCCVANAFRELSNWCKRGKRDWHFATVNRIIVAVTRTEAKTADIYLDDFIIEGKGLAKAVRAERNRRQAARVRVTVVTQEWSDKGRTLDAVLHFLDLAAAVGSDIVLLPMECVKTDGEPIPGPISNAIAERAKRYKFYVIGSIREKEKGKTFVTSFLCDREGRIIGRYRKSHKMPDERMALGDDLPAFETDFGKIAMRIGSDRFFPEIDLVYAAKGARMIFWSQEPEPIEDEYLQDFPSAGRAADDNIFIACARYAFKGHGWITNFFPPYCGCPIGRSYVIDRHGQRIASTGRSPGIATAVIPLKDFSAPARQPSRKRAFRAIARPVKIPESRKWKKRRVRVSAIEGGVPFDQLLHRLDEAGQIGSDIVCTYELVWFPIHAGANPSAEKLEECSKVAKRRLCAVAEKAKQYHMYVLIAGVVERIERNEAILFNREGREVGRYFKIAKTHDAMIPGNATPVLETDFGRIGVRICADEWMWEIDRCYGIKGVDILFTPTQSWGPDALFRDLRDISRAMDNGFFLVECTHASTEARHRSIVVDPCGAIVASSSYRRNGLLSAEIDLDHDRPLRAIRKFKPYKPHGYLPQYQPTEMPETSNDLRETILRQRRPELYRILVDKDAK